jgi:hypothetical protein
MLISIIASNEIFNDENLVRFREYHSFQNENGNQIKTFTFQDKGDGFQSKIFEDDLNETLRRDRYIKLKGNFLVVGSNQKIVNVYDCVDLCSDGYQLVPLYKNPLKIATYDENGRHKEIQRLPVVVRFHFILKWKGRCLCKKFEKKINKVIEEEFDSPFGTFEFKLKSKNENRNNIEFSNFQQQNGKFFGDSNFDQHGVNKVEISGNFIPKRKFN